ncbi:MAG TPA: hypothetical protein DCS97_15635 [Planctomycetes bacterium]|nr:hypothetical protein [Planctomycetota bacterium]
MNSTVLIVDDDIALLDALRRSLRNVPYHIIAVADAQRALEQLEERPIDVVVSDDQMPGMGGIELLTAIRRHHPAVVSIMMSGRTTIGGMVHAINDGEIFRFLIKPCLAAEVDRSIRLALAQKMVLDHCRRLLPLMRRQSALLGAIERDHPGLVAAQSQALNGNFSLSSDDFTAMDGLAESIEVEIHRVETTLIPHALPDLPADAGLIRAVGPSAP